MTSNLSYTATGHELAENRAERATAWSIISPVLLDGKETMLTGYTIGDDSYFSLRDMGEALDFSVGWFDTLGYIVASTQKSHDEAPLTLEDEYQLIIDSKPLYDAGLDGLYDAVDGLVYADLIDFSNDDTPELLLISIAENNAGEVTIYDVTFDVYGDIQGHAGSYGTITSEYMFGDEAVGLYKSGGKTYIGTFYSSSARTASYIYSGLTGTEFIEIEHIGEVGGWSDEVNGYIADYSKNGTALTEEQFNAEMGKYSEETRILSFSSYASETPFRFQNRGILPEIPDITVTVNGEKISLENVPFLEKGYVMLPLRPIVEKAGVTVCANSSMNTILATTKRNTLDISDTFRMWGDTSGEYTMSFNDESLSIGGNSPAERVEPRMIDGQLCVPIKPIVMKFGGEVTWDTPTKTYAITLDIPAADRMSLSDAQSMVEFSFESAKQIAAQNGYVFTPHPVDEWDSIQGFEYGKAYWWMCVLPASITEAEADNLFWQGIDKYEAVTVWNDGTVG